MKEETRFQVTTEYIGGRKYKSGHEDYHFIMVSGKWLLLLLSHFSCIRLCVTPQVAAHQASLSLRFSRREYWNGLPFPSPMHAGMLSRFSRVQLYDPMDSSPPGSSVPGILQARTLEWVAISFFNACMHAKLLQPWPTLCDPTDSSPPGSSVHGILQARILEWVAISFSTGTWSSYLIQLRTRTQKYGHVLLI